MNLGAVRMTLSANPVATGCYPSVVAHVCKIPQGESSHVSQFCHEIALRSHIIYSWVF